MPVVGFLNPRTAAQGQSVVRAFRQGLQEAGFTEGDNVIVIYRWAEDDYSHLPKFAAELVERHVNVIAAGGSAWIAACNATKTTPIVFTTGLNPVQTDMVKSLSRPEANLTGASPFRRRSYGAPTR